VLLAEDDPNLLRLLSTVLAFDGYDVIEATNGVEMLDYLAACGARGAPDVIVSDVCMPGASGIDVLGRMRALQIAAPVVLMTAFPEHCNEQSARELGATTLLEKPFELDDLRMIVLNLVPPQALPLGAATPLSDAR
jgi:CheY-like chemotaxis protein